MPLPFQYDLYDGMPPHVAASETSAEAARSIIDSVGRLQAVCYKHIFLAATRGATCDEIEAALGLRHQTASARIRELVLKRYIADTGVRRLTRSNRSAVAWIAVRQEGR